MMTNMEEEEIQQLQSQTEKRDSKESEADFEEAARNLAQGFSDQYQVHFEEIKKKLGEVRSKQDTLLDQMQIENEKLQETFNGSMLDQMFQTIKISQGKLVLIKKVMASIHKRTFKLKKRALRVQQIKQIEALNKEQQREQEIRREQELIGKPVIS